MIAMPRSLSTTQLTLRRPSTADIPAIYGYASDPESTRFMDWATHIDEDDSADYLEDWLQGWDDGDEFLYLLERQDSGEVAGAASVTFDAHGARFGYILGSAHWGRGLATEAATALFECARKIDDVWRFWATVDVDNTASARVLEKISLVREARLACWSPRPNIDASGRPRDVHVYAVTR